MSAAIEQRNQDATAYCGGLDERVTEELLWELMLQAGPVVNVHIPRDKVSGGVELSIDYRLSMLADDIFIFTRLTGIAIARSLCCASSGGGVCG